MDGEDAAKDLEEDDTNAGMALEYLWHAQSLCSADLNHDTSKGCGIM